MPKMNDSPAASIACWFASEIPGIRDHGDVGQSVGGHERLNHRQHRLRPGLVSLERRDHERDPSCPASRPIVFCGSSRRSLENPGSRKPSPLVGLEVEGGYVIEDQRRRPQPGVRGAGLRQGLSP
jgi:hypothetical protein